MKVLLTGATGFLGSHLTVSLLERQYTVIATKRANSSIKEFEDVCTFRGLKKELLNNLQWIECDILDTIALTQAMQGIEQVYHTAAIVSFWRKRADEMLHTNVEGTANVVNCALAAGVKKLCYASSIAAIGREKSGDEITEESPWHNSKYNTKYAISKYLAEMEVWRGSEEGLNAVIVNPGIILGEGKWDKGSCRLFDTAYKGLKFYTNGINGYVDVIDVATAMIQLTESPIINKRYILVAQNLSFKDFFTRLAKQFSKSPPSIKTGFMLSQVARLLYALKALSSGKEPLVTKETARNSQQQFIYKSTKLNTDLGFEYTSIDNTIERVCKAYLHGKTK